MVHFINALYRAIGRVVVLAFALIGVWFAALWLAPILVPYLMEGYAWLVSLIADGRSALGL